MDPLDRALIAATQDGLPLVPRPYAVLAGQIGIDEAEVMTRLEQMLLDGRIRRIGAVPNHYALGIRANGMSVWDIDDIWLPALGPQVGALAFVSHCYERPRRLPTWRYNFFAMVHGRDRNEVETKVATIAAIIGPRARAHEVLYSTRILKKTGLRIAG